MRSVDPSRLSGHTSSPQRGDVKDSLRARSSVFEIHANLVCLLFQDRFRGQGRDLDLDRGLGLLRLVFIDLRRVA